MLLPELEYHRPTTARAAAELATALTAAGREVHLLSGGTDLVPKLKRQGGRCVALVSLADVAELRGVRADGAKLIIGARTRLAELTREPLVRRHCPVVAHAAGLVGSPQIRNTATLGGNLVADNRCVYYDQSEVNRDTHGACFKAHGDVCHMVKVQSRDQMPLCRARFISDVAPALILLDATVRLVGPAGERTLPLAALYQNDGIKRHRKDGAELIAAIEIPLPAPTAVAYDKLRIRAALEFPSAGVAVRLDGPRGAPTTVAVAVTGTDTHPIVVRREAAGLAAGVSLVETAAQAASAAVAPLNQDVLPPSYRRFMVGVMVRRLAAGMG